MGKKAEKRVAAAIEKADVEVVYRTSRIKKCRLDMLEAEGPGKLILIVEIKQHALAISAAMDCVLRQMGNEIYTEADENESNSQ